MLIRILMCVIVIDLWAYMHGVQAPPEGLYSFPGVVVSVTALGICDVILEKLFRN